jgi:hypothetical protein
MRINEIIDNNSNLIDEEEQGTSHGQKIVWDDKNNYFVRTREGEPPARVWGTAINKMVDDKYDKMKADDKKLNKLDIPWDDPLLGPLDTAGMTRDELRTAKEKRIGQASDRLATWDARESDEIDYHLGLGGKPRDRERERKEDELKYK